MSLPLPPKKPKGNSVKVATPYGERGPSRRDKPGIKLPIDTGPASGDDKGASGAADSVTEKKAENKSELVANVQGDSDQSVDISASDDESGADQQGFFDHFVKHVAPSVGLHFALLESGDSPYLPNAVLPIGAGGEVYSYIVVVSTPVDASLEGRYKIGVPQAFYDKYASGSAENLDKSLYVFVYMRYHDVDTTEFPVIAAVWGLHIDDFLGVCYDYGESVGDVLIIDARHMDCYGLNAAGNPVELALTD